MTIEELYQALDNVTMLTKLYIFNGNGDILEWGKTYHELPNENHSIAVVHCKYIDGDMIIWV